MDVEEGAQSIIRKVRESIPIRGIEFKYLSGSVELFSMEDVLKL